MKAKLLSFDVRYQHIGGIYPAGTANYQYTGKGTRQRAKKEQCVRILRSYDSYLHAKKLRYDQRYKCATTTKKTHGLLDHHLRAVGMPN